MGDYCFELTYDDIPRILKRYSFESKMSICYEFSRQLLKTNGSFDVKNLTKHVYPWELETFFLLSIRAMPEYNNNDFNGKNRNKFINIINLIRNKEYSPSDTDIELHRLLGTLALNQFDCQEYIYYKFYRYNYIFNFKNDVIDVKSKFVKMFGIEYKGFLELAVILNLWIGANLDWQQIPNINNYLFSKRFPNEFRALTISLQEYKKIMDNLTTNINDYISCYRPSFQYPFISNGDFIYFPLPHLLSRAVTSSMYYRLTKDKNDRSLLGKEVLESYLFHILDNAEVYEEIYGEQVFKIEHKQDFRTADILIKEKGELLFIDSKSTVPGTGLRIRDDDSFTMAQKILVENVIKLYKHIAIYYDRYPKYNVFNGKPDIAMDHRWGIIAILEDNYIQRELIYSTVAKELSLSVDSEEYNWLTHHIKIASFYDIERFSICKRSIIPLIIDQMNDNRPYDFSFYGKSAEKENNSYEYTMFFQELKKCYDDFVGDLVKDGIVNKEN